MGVNQVAVNRSVSSLAERVHSKLLDKMLWGFIFTTQNCDVRVVVPIALEIMPSTAACYYCLLLCTNCCRLGEKSS